MLEAADIDSARHTTRPCFPPAGTHSRPDEDKSDLRYAPLKCVVRIGLQDCVWPGPLEQVNAGVGRKDYS